MSVKKKFDKYLHQKYDDRAKTASKALLKAKGYDVVDNPNPYAEDLIAQKGSDAPFFVEVEIKDLWKGSEFPFQTVQLPERKKKFAVNKTVFMIWNSETTHCACFSSDAIWGVALKEVPNKKGPEGERLFQIPLSKIKFRKL